MNLIRAKNKGFGLQQGVARRLGNLSFFVKEKLVCIQSGCLTRRDLSLRYAKGKESK